VYCLQHRCGLDDVLVESRVGVVEIYTPVEQLDLAQLRGLRPEYKP